MPAVTAPKPKAEPDAAAPARHITVRPRRVSRQRNAMLALALAGIPICVFAIVLMAVVLFHYSDVFHALASK